MREIDVGRVEETVRALFLSAFCEIGGDVLGLLERRLEEEEAPFGREVLRQLIENAQGGTLIAVTHDDRLAEMFDETLDMNAVAEAFGEEAAKHA